MKRRKFIAMNIAMCTTICFLVACGAENNIVSVETAVETTDSSQETTETDILMNESLENQTNYAAVETPFTYEDETALLKEYSTMYEGENLQISYVFDCEEYAELLEQYPIAQIAGEGSEFERVLRLLDEYCCRLPHKSDYDNSIEENALALLAHSLDQTSSNGINCRAKAEILNEMCLALGIYSRRVSINPYSSVDSDCHVVNEIYDTSLQKWIMVDMTTDGYIVDENDFPLSVLEIREYGSSGKYCALMCGNIKCETQPTAEEYTDMLTYYMKNVFYFVIYEEQGFGMHGDGIFFIPENFHIVDRLVAGNLNDLKWFENTVDYAEMQQYYEEQNENLHLHGVKIGNVEELRKSPK